MPQWPFALFILDRLHGWLLHVESRFGDSDIATHTLVALQLFSLVFFTACPFRANTTGTKTCSRGIVSPAVAHADRAICARSQPSILFQSTRYAT